MKYEDTMVRVNRKKACNPQRGLISGLGIVAMLALAGAPLASFAAEGKQEAYSTPEAAVDALIAANRTGSQPELLKILGPGAQKLISSGDPVADKESRDKFITAYDTAHKLVGDSDDKKELVVGDKEWPLPVPLVRHGGKWRFDTAVGEQEILDRRVGHNELNVIEVCREYVAAQEEYADQYRLKNGKPEYAQRILSHEGKRDGLYWPISEGEKESPLGPLIVTAEAEGYDKKAADGKHEPYHGYYYKILTAQSKNASGGAANYISDGHMTGGFALLAFPAKYGDSGIMTFIVSQNGIIHEKDLGPNTAKIAPGIKLYDPDGTWKLP
jgi:hypothetical protein